MNDKSGKRKYGNVEEAQWREVPPSWSRSEIAFAVFLGVLFLGGAFFMFLTSGIPQWWELKRHGEETLAQVVGLEFMVTPGAQDPGDTYDRLTVSFRDRQNRHHQVFISERGRFARDQRINRHNPHPSLPKDAWIIYSRRNPQIAELRDFRQHGWWMAGLALVVAAMYPGFLYLAQREKKRAGTEENERR